MPSEICSFHEIRFQNENTRFAFISIKHLIAYVYWTCSIGTQTIQNIVHKYKNTYSLFRSMKFDAKA